MNSDINKAAITVEDCIDMYEKKNLCAVINDGVVVDFVRENEPMFGTKYCYKCEDINYIDGDEEV